MWSDFKAFIMRGNVLDLAIAVIIGGAFGKIVTSLVNDIIMPLIGLALGGISLADRFVSLNGQSYPTLEAAQTAGAATLNYGLFINAIIDFLIIAFVIFLLVRTISRFKGPAPVAPNTTKACPYCQTVIPVAATRCPNCTSELAARPG
ncbi:MAG TPA: large conductance mechanosensitive channel protein MscL [Chloroflexia bacterium]|nr:large conductance mechanosensitive channel protein MscL [Chloroflexia bacterium]